MKFIHVSDLHFGKNLYGYSMVEEGDQKYWCDQFLELVDNEKPEAILISGDVYDRGVPPKEAVELLDWFLTSLADKNIPVLMIAGNHDSGTRLSFGSKLFKNRNIHIAGEIKKEIEHIILKDEYGDVVFWLLPYVFPAAVQAVLGDDNISGYDNALRRLLDEQDIDFSKRNVILSHQTVLNNGQDPETEGSETAIGGIGGINVDAYDGFDYVALGHIHSAQLIGKENIRYCGSPICYHFGETKKSHKGPVIVKLGKKGDFSYRIEELPALHPMKEIKGSFMDICSLLSKDRMKGVYFRIVITDDIVPADARATLLDVIEKKNSKLMELAHEPENRAKVTHDVYKGEKQKTVDELFTDFYRSRNNDEFPSENDQDLIRFIGEQVYNADDYEKPSEPSQKDIDKIIEFVMKQEGAE